MSEKTAKELGVSELEALYEEALNKLPSKAPIFLPTERMPLEKRLEGVKRVDHIYKNTLDSVYRPKLKELRKKHKGSKRCFIIGNGPSLNDTNLELLKDEVTFAVNGFFLKSDELSWTPTYYVVEDHLVAEDRLEAIKKFKGPTKLFPVYLGYCFEEADDTIFYNHRPRVSYPDGFDFSTDAAKITYTGCTVTFSCMQLAHYMGFEEIYLIGVDASYEIPDDVDDSDEYNVGVLDMKSDDPNHFHPDYFGKGFRWHDPQVHKMIEAYKEARKITDLSGRRIYNATVGGKLEVFDRVSFDSLFTEPTPSTPFQQNSASYPNQYPRVLIFDITLLGNGTATGEVKKNLFQDWPKERIGQFFSTGREKIGWSSNGEKILDKLSQEKAVDIAESFKADVILYRPVADNLELHKAAMRTIKQLRLPFVTWYMDDWPERYKRENPERFNLFDDDLHYLINHSVRALVIGDMMQDAYEKRYGRKFIPLANGVHETDWPEPEIEEITGRPFKVRYAGSLAENMTLDSLLRVAEAIEKLSNEYEVIFEIKTMQLWYDLTKSKFKKFKKTTFLVQNLTDEEYKTWIREADTLVIAYNFDSKSKIYTQYSVANKMPECLASGVPILAHGPKDVATLDLLERYGCAQFAHVPQASKVAEEIEKLISSPTLRKRLSQKGRRVAFDNHNLVDLKAELKDILGESCMPHTSNRPINLLPAIILGNGPSLKGFDFSNFEGKAVFGMNAAYRYWDKINWYPDYYSCLDLVLGLSHKEEIKRLIENSHEYGIKKFLLRDNLIQQMGPIKNGDRVVNFDIIQPHSHLLSAPTISTGSHTAGWAAMLGYKHIYLMGIDCNYVEIVDGAVKGKNGTELIIQEEKSNPNYFFDGYQKKGDLYNVPNPGKDVHLQSWQEISEAIAFTPSTIVNANLKSKVDIFDFCKFEDIRSDGSTQLIPKEKALKTTEHKVEFPNKISDLRYPREAKAGFDETYLIFKIVEENDPGIMVDVGAHYGGSARPFAKNGWSVFCQEPDPKNRAHLVRSLGKNKLVKIDPRAVGEIPETGRVFYSSDESTGISGMLAFRETHEQSATVDVTTVAEIIKEQDISHIDFLKIDVEGYDFGVLKGVPWDDMKPDIIECEFEDAKTKHLGHSWTDICDYLVNRGYTVYLSEWHPIIRYGIPHDWAALKRYPCELEDINAWGNLLAFKNDPGEKILCENLEKVLSLRNKEFTGKAPPVTIETQTENDVVSNSAAQAPNSTQKTQVKKPVVSQPAKLAPSDLAALPKDRFADRLRRRSPALFRIAQACKWGLIFLKRHLVSAIFGLFLLTALIAAPFFFSVLTPFAWVFWAAAAIIILAMTAVLGASFANMMANRIADRERLERRNLRAEVLRTVDSVQNSQNQRNTALLNRLSDEISDRKRFENDMKSSSLAQQKQVENKIETTRRNTLKELNSSLNVSLKELEKTNSEAQDAAIGELRNHIQSLESALRKKLSQTENVIASSQADSEKRLDRMAQEFKKRLQEGLENLQKDITDDHRAASEKRLEEVTQEFKKRLQEGLENLQKDITDNQEAASEKRLDEVTQEFKKRLQEGLVSLQKNITDNQEAASEKRLGEITQEFKGRLQEGLESLQKDITDDQKESIGELENRFGILEETLKNQLEDRDKKIEELWNTLKEEIKAASSKDVETKLESLASSMNKEIASIKEKSTAANKETAGSLEKVSLRLKSLDSKIDDEANKDITKTIKSVVSKEIEQESKRNSTTFMMAQEQLEERLEKRFSETQSLIEKAQAELAQNETKLQKLDNQNDEARQNLENEISQSKEQIDNLQTMLSTATETIRSMEGQNETLQSELKGQFVEALARIDKANKSSQNAHSQITDLEKKLQETQQQVMTETSALQMLEGQSKKLKEDMNTQLDDALSKLNATDESAKTAHSQITSLEEKLQETRRQIRAEQEKQNENTPVKFQHFNRILSKNHIQVLEEKWLKPLNLTESEKSIAYSANRIVSLEDRMKGRLATSLENAVLRTLVAKSVNGKSLKVLEIGVLFGVGLAMIYDRTVDTFDNVHLTAIDPFEGYYGGNALDIITNERITENVFLDNMAAARIPRDNLTLHKGFSTDDDIIKAASKDQYDILIIDGDHSYAGVKADFVNYAPFVKRGGYILIDDDSAPEWPEITEYVDEELLPRQDITLVGRSWRTAVFRVVKKIKE
ncbi:FkbM family methyltransferase [Litorimonas sp.]|uniref:FkbM family methyltransferase n=1 Tax=Litorimonas sp. TaxID=1892381 RepID=UPI003A89580B